MKIEINNRVEEFEQTVMTVAELLEVKKFSFKMLIVRINGELIKREDFGTAVVRNGDSVHVLHLMSGG